MEQKLGNILRSDLNKLWHIHVLEYSTAVDTGILWWHLLAQNDTAAQQLGKENLQNKRGSSSFEGSLGSHRAGKTWKEGQEVESMDLGLNSSFTASWLGALRQSWVNK